MTALVAAPAVATAVAEAIADAVVLTDVVRNGPVLGLLAAGLAAGAVLVLLGGRGDPATPGHETLRAPVGSGPAAPPPSTGPTPSIDSIGRRVTDAEVSSALALLALAYRSGLPTWDVLEAVATGLTGRASTDLRQVAAALRWGATEADAWASVGQTWSPAIRAVAIAHQAGVPPGAMLLAASDDLHSAELERLEVSAAKVGVRLVAPLGLVLLPAFCLTTVAPLVIALASDLIAA
ncbi:type II secretion system F family protein [Terracoccus sp. 273MFTsu3.1]|uniref:type II secretion system F family protein n=1 Tax=Terracoccus sp. 273MFTsu3.1 TaxID=1172188 RepID=UPI0003A0FC1C|nr:type II secretion system F family protein [Terracoccus sp. 273MFTsu3.1]